MYSAFGYTPNRVSFQQENSKLVYFILLNELNILIFTVLLDVVARKPGLSTRKPFAERKIDSNVQQASIVQTKATPSNTTKPPSQDKIFVDYCSYKDVPGN